MKKRIGRREFIKGTTTVAGLLIVFPSCVSDNTRTAPDITETGGCQSGNGDVKFLNAGTTHSHEVVDLSAGIIQNQTVGVYQLLGGGHLHTFSLSAQNLADLNNGVTITINGDVEGHGHNISIVKC